MEVNRGNMSYSPDDELSYEHSVYIKSEIPDTYTEKYETSPQPIEEKNDVLRCFIEKYEASPQLWDPTHPAYINKAARNEKLDELKEIYTKIMPNCTRDNVKRKINTLRSNYRKEVKKILDSMKSGRSSEEIYRPTSWVYYALKFLDGLVHQQPDEMTPTITAVATYGSEAIEENSIEDGISLSAMSMAATVPQSPAFKKARVVSPLARQSATMEQPAVDTIPSIAKAWGEKLVTLHPQQRNFAEKAINDILFEASMGTLHRHSVKINEPIFQRKRPPHPSMLPFQSNDE